MTAGYKRQTTPPVGALDCAKEAPCDDAEGYQYAKRTRVIMCLIKKEMEQEMRELDEAIKLFEEKIAAYENNENDLSNI